MRIHLDEIESALLSIQSVNQAASLCIEGKLHAYLVLKPLEQSSIVHVNDLRDALARVVPGMQAMHNDICL